MRGYRRDVVDFLGWPVLRQVTGRDRLGRGHAVQSERSRTLEPRTVTADRVVDSVCPYCAVGCAQKVFVKDEKVVQIEGNPASPISRGRLCPKGSASKQLVTSATRVTQVRYRRPYATEWEDLDLDTAMDMIADRVIKTRKEFWEWEADGQPHSPHHGHRQPRRSDPRQRGELPHEEALHGDGRDPDREPGADMTLLHGPRSGDLVRPWWRNDQPAWTCRTLTAS